VGVVKSLRPSHVPFFGTNATKMSAFTREEREFVVCAGEANVLDMESCCAITARLERAVRDEEFYVLERLLAALLNCRVGPSQLAILCRSDLGALVGQLHRRSMTAEWSFVIRLSTLLVMHWGELLKIAALTIEPKPAETANMKPFTSSWKSGRAF
jgi:hypothetical protein